MDYDHTQSAYAAVLDGAVSPAGVDYGRMAERRAALAAWLRGVSSADEGGFTAAQREAFEIDAYNGFTLLTVIDALPIGSILELDGGKVWDARSFVVGGQRVTLNELETRIRGYGDARVHAALNCASKGCPPLSGAPFTAEALDAQLEAATKAWIGSTAVSADTTSIRLSHVFEWYAKDFAAARTRDVSGADDAQDAALLWIVAHGGSAELASGTRAVSWAEYDWALNSK